MKQIGAVLKKGRKYTARPRYTLVLHEVRSKLDLSLSAYAVIDSIHKLSRTNPEHPWCIMGKEQMANFLKLSRATIFRAIQEGTTRRTRGGARQGINLASLARSPRLPRYHRASMSGTGN